MCYRFNNTDVQLVVSSSLQEMSLHCLQTTCSLVLGLSWQTCESRSAILCGKENPKHFSSGVWNILHWIKTASPLRETKVHVNADHNYSCLTALAVEPVRQETCIAYVLLSFTFEALLLIRVLSRVDFQVCNYRTLFVFASIRNTER